MIEPNAEPVRKIGPYTIPAQKHPADVFYLDRTRSAHLQHLVQEWHEMWYPSPAEACEMLLRLVAWKAGAAYRSEFIARDYVHDSHTARVVSMTGRILTDIKNWAGDDPKSVSLLVESLVRAAQGLLKTALENEAELNKEPKSE